MLLKMLPTFNIYPKLFYWPSPHLITRNAGQTLTAAYQWPEQKNAICPKQIEDRTTKIFDVLNIHERHAHLPLTKAAGLTQSGRCGLKSISLSELMRKNRSAGLSLELAEYRQ